MKKLVFAVFAVLSIEASFAAESPIEELTGFLKKNVIGKRLHTKGTFKIANDKVKAEFERVTTFANLAVLEGGISFDEVVDINQTDTDLEKEGSPSRDSKRHLVARHLVRQMKSSGALLGRFIYVSATTPYSLFSTFDETLELKGDTLEIKQRRAAYTDCPGVGGKPYPCSGDTDYELIASKDGLKRNETTRTYNIDPKTGIREGKPVEDLSVDTELKKEGSAPAKTK